MEMERVTQEFRGARCKARMEEWERAMAAQGFRRESFSGWSGPGAYKHGSLTVARPKSVAAARETYNEQTLFKVFNALRRTGLPERVAQDAITEMQNEGILFRERVGV